MLLTGFASASAGTLSVSLLDVTLNSARTDNGGSVVPPWNSAIVERMVVADRTATGSYVTIVPVTRTTGAVHLRVLRTAQQSAEDCDGNTERWWQASLTAVHRKSFLNARPEMDRGPRFLLQVVAIHPVQRRARQLPRSRIYTDRLPPGVFPRTVEAAVDLNDAGAADIVLVINGCSHARAQAQVECTTLSTQSTPRPLELAFAGAWMRKRGRTASAHNSYSSHLHVHQRPNITPRQYLAATTHVPVRAPVQEMRTQLLALINSAEPRLNPRERQQPI